MSISLSHTNKTNLAAFFCSFDSVCVSTHDAVGLICQNKFISNKTWAHSGTFYTLIFRSTNFQDF